MECNFKVNEKSKEVVFHSSPIKNRQAARSSSHGVAVIILLSRFVGNSVLHFFLRKSFLNNSNYLLRCMCWVSLQAFSKNSYHNRFCLAHLFTYQAFTGGVLGLAYIGSPRTYSVGGICSPGDYLTACGLFSKASFSSPDQHLFLCVSVGFLVVPITQYANFSYIWS